MMTRASRYRVGERRRAGDGEAERALQIAGVTPSAAMADVHRASSRVAGGGSLIAPRPFTSSPPIGRCSGAMENSRCSNRRWLCLVAVWWRGLDDLAGRAALFAAAVLTGVLLAGGAGVSDRRRYVRTVCRVGRGDRPLGGHRPSAGAVDAVARTRRHCGGAVFPDLRRVAFGVTSLDFCSPRTRRSGS